MKKLFLCALISTMALGASAQETVMGSKLTDNWFIGIGGGVYEPTVGQNVFKDLRPTAYFEIGRYLTPVFGLRANGSVGINNNNGNSRSNLTNVYPYTYAASNPFAWKGYHTVFDFTNVGLDALFNLNNLFAGYAGAPRPVEVVASAGMGWGWYRYAGDHKDYVTAKFGLDFNFNVTSALQLSLRPYIIYNFQDNNTDLDINSSYLNLTAGLAYKLPNSNGTHNFKLCDKKYTQAEMDEMNARINGLRNDYEGKLASANNTIKGLQDALAAEKAKDKTVIVNKNTTQLAPVVIFDQGKSVINKSQQASVQMIATYMKNHPNSHVTIKGYASPEGDKELNQKLSEARAQAVYNMLTKTYKIDGSRLSKQGLGETTEVFDEYDWNRVCIFEENK